MAMLGDSYAAGYGMSPPDCGTDLASGSYYRDTNIPVRRGWKIGASCIPSTQSYDPPPDLLAGPFAPFPDPALRPIVTYHNECHRSPEAYPSLIRRALGVQARDALFEACSGATTGNVITSAQFVNSPPNVAGGYTQMRTLADFAQLGVPNLITMSIGGNDAGFSDIMAACVALVTTCLTTTFVTDYERMIQTLVRPALIQTFKSLRARYPQPTRIAVFGYPSFISSTRSLEDCLFATAIVLDRAERRWIEDQALPELNAAVAEAASVAGVTYVDITEATVGHEICTETPYINSLYPGAFHPNAAGHRAIADFFLKRYTDGRGLLTFTDPAPGPAPPPLSGQSSFRFGSVTIDPATPVQGSCGTTCLDAQMCGNGCLLQLQGSGFFPNSLLQATAFSTPTPLGTIAVDADGNIDTTLSAPSTLQPGAHVLQLTGTNPDGRAEYAFAVFEIPSEGALRRDTTPPVVACGAADGQWHGTNVAIPCTAKDDGSGLVDVGDAAFTLATSVPAGTETADAATATRSVCDLAGNCATAGPVAGNKVDRKPPTLQLPSGIIVNATDPTGTHLSYTVRAVDGGDPAPHITCVPASGVFAIGVTTVQCSAVDQVGNSASGSFNITVRGSVEQILDLIKATTSSVRFPGFALLLTQPLRQAIAAIARQAPRVACVNLASFRLSVRALLPPLLQAQDRMRLLEDTKRVEVIAKC